MPSGASHHFSDLEGANLGEDELNSLDSGCNVYPVGVGSLNVNVTAGRYTTSGGIVDFAGAAGVALAASTLNQQIYLTVPGGALTVGSFPGGEHMPLAEVDTSGVEVIAVRDKRPRMTSALSATAPGDVSGPGSSVNSELTLFDGATGKLLKAGSGLSNTGAGEINGRVIATDGTKLDTIASGAQVNPAQVSGGEITAGSVTATRLWSPADVKSAVLQHAPGQTRTLWTPAQGDTFGAYPGKTLGTSGAGQFGFVAPADMQTLVSAKLIGIVQAGADSTGRNIDLTTQYGGAGEDFNFHGAVDSATTYDFSGKLLKKVEIDFTALLGDLLAGDTGGLQVNHNAIGGDVTYLGTLLTYTVQ